MIRGSGVTIVLSSTHQLQEAIQSFETKKKKEKTKIILFQKCLFLQIAFPRRRKKKFFFATKETNSRRNKPENYFSVAPQQLLQKQQKIRPTNFFFGFFFLGIAQFVFLYSHRPFVPMIGGTDSMKDSCKNNGKVPQLTFCLRPSAKDPGIT